MKTAPVLLAALCVPALAACGSATEKQTDAVVDRIDRQAAAGTNVPTRPAEAPAKDAFGLSETQLLDADLVTRDGTSLGEIEQIRRDASGAITGLLVELANTDPDRYVVVPLSDLSTRKSGNDTDLQTAMTAAQLAALPDATLPSR